MLRSHPRLPRLDVTARPGRDGLSMRLTHAPGSDFTARPGGIDAVHTPLRRHREAWSWIQGLD